MVKWWADGSHGVHPDMHGQSGESMSMGKGTILSGSSKQKINTNSLTKTELVAAHDAMPRLPWTNNFLEAQGYQTSGTILNQDNQSTIHMENNGCRSSMKRTRHMNIHYFFITNRINTGNLRVQFCPTLEMIADFFTKPLQGKLFIKFCDLIMGHNNGD